MSEFTKSIRVMFNKKSQVYLNEPGKTEGEQTRRQKIFEEWRKIGQRLFQDCGSL
jgi:hypothetical protein